MIAQANITLSRLIEESLRTDFAENDAAITYTTAYLISRWGQVMYTEQFKNTVFLIS